MRFWRRSSDLREARSSATISPRVSASAIASSRAESLSERRTEWRYRIREATAMIVETSAAAGLAKACMGVEPRDRPRRRVRELGERWRPDAPAYADRLHARTTTR